MWLRMFAAGDLVEVVVVAPAQLTKAPCGRLSRPSPGQYLLITWDPARVMPGPRKYCISDVIRRRHQRVGRLPVPGCPSVCQPTALQEGRAPSHGPTGGLTRAARARLSWRFSRCACGLRRLQSSRGVCRRTSSGLAQEPVEGYPRDQHGRPRAAAGTVRRRPARWFDRVGGHAGAAVHHLPPAGDVALHSLAARSVSLRREQWQQRLQRGRRVPTRLTSERVPPAPTHGGVPRRSGRLARPPSRP